MRKASIVASIGSWGSGLAQLLVLDAQGRPDRIYCENAPTVRALAGCFPDEEIIGEGHTVNNDALLGKAIVYDVDDLGLLQWIAAGDESEREEDTHVVTS